MDIFDAGKKRIIAAGMITIAACILMVLLPDMMLRSARKGISLWLTDVLPALFPFFICANFLQNIGVVQIFKSGTFPFAMSVLSGYPMGAKIVGDLMRSREISLTEAKRLMSFCNTSGPAFMVGAVGAGMLGSQSLGGIIAISHYAGAIINGIFYTRMLGRDNCISSPKKLPLNKGLQELFTDAILAAFRSLGIILAYIVLFMFLTDLLEKSDIFSAVENQGIQALTKGFFEMTVGCSAVAECTAVSERMKAILCTWVMSWGGLSVMGQTMSMLSGTGIPMGFLMVTKLTHAFFSAVTAFLITGFMI